MENVPRPDAASDSAKKEGETLEALGCFDMKMVDKERCNLSVSSRCMSRDS